MEKKKKKQSKRECAFNIALACGEELSKNGAVKHENPARVKARVGIKTKKEAGTIYRLAGYHSKVAP